jgi:hypothetical protein
MPSGGVRVEGLNKLVRDLQELGLQLDDLKDAFSTVARQGAEKAAQFAPKGKTGRLASSIRGNRAKNKAIVTAGKAKVKYAGVINYGWPRRNIAPSSFMQKADKVMRPVALRKLDEEIEKAIRRRGLG